MNRVQPETTLPTDPKIKIYAAILIQTGTAAPIATVLQNTLGNLVWTRTDVGEYIGTLVNGFKENKTWIIISQNSNAGTYISAYSDDNSIYLITPSDSTLQNASIEIRVYN